MTTERERHEEGSERGGIALSAVALTVMSGVTASAHPNEHGHDSTVTAIDAVKGHVRDSSVAFHAADANIAVANGVRVHVAGDAKRGVAIDGPGANDVQVGLPFADQASRATVEDGSIVYDNNNGSTTTPLVHQDGSVQILTTISAPSAPTRYTYVINAASGGGLVLTEDGGVDVVGPDGFVVSHVMAPWAVDAKGNSVPTHFSIDGDSLTEVIDLGAATAYPVVADPKFTHSWWNQTLYFNKTETAVFAAGGAAAGWIAHYFGLTGSVISGVLTGYASAFGIYIAAGKCGKLVMYIGYPTPVPQPYWGGEAGGYCK